MFMDADQIKLTMSKKLRKKDYILHFIKLFFFVGNIEDIGQVTIGQN